jgi:hypothetical protein
MYEWVQRSQFILAYGLIFHLPLAGKYSDSRDTANDGKRTLNRLNGGRYPQCQRVIDPLLSLALLCALCV